MTTTKKTNKAFAKGDLVTCISNWDDKGTTMIRDAVVHSCGLKRMILTDAETGEEFGEEYYRPQNALEAGTLDGVFPRLTEEDATRRGLDYAASFLAGIREIWEGHIVRNSHDAGYCRSIRQDIDELHEPRVDSYSRVNAEDAAITARFAARGN